MKVALFCKPASPLGSRSDLVEFMRGEVEASDIDLAQSLTVELKEFFKIIDSNGSEFWVRAASVDAFRVLDAQS